MAIRCGTTPEPSHLLKCFSPWTKENFAFTPVFSDRGSRYLWTAFPRPGMKGSKRANSKALLLLFSCLKKGKLNDNRGSYLAGFKTGCSGSSPR